MDQPSGKPLSGSLGTIGGGGGSFLDTLFGGFLSINSIGTYDVYRDCSITFFFLLKIDAVERDNITINRTRKLNNPVTIKGDNLLLEEVLSAMGSSSITNSGNVA